MEIRRLSRGDDRSAFRSGDDDLDRFFHRFAGQNQFRHHLGVTYVAVDGAILGFATTSVTQLVAAELPSRLDPHLPRYPLPALRLARLAVSASAQGRGVGLALLLYVFRLAREMAELVGCVGVIVDAKPQAVAFYARFGFVPLATRAGRLGDRPEPAPMFLELEAIPPGASRGPG